MSEVILYSNKCPQCRILEAKLKEKGIEYQEVNDIDLMLEKGFMSMPMLEVGETIMNFAQANNWVNERT